MVAIATRGLTKRYKRVVALRDLELSVPEGSLFGFLGPNGAGKTTAIRILLGLLHRSSGEARVFDQDCWRFGPRIREQIGYLPGDVRFYDELTGRRTLNFFNDARRAGARPEIERLAGIFNLELDKRVRDYSRGMKQKLGLIQAMMHRPKLLILDEPTTALDPLVRQTLFDELRSAANQGRTVLFSSHTLAEVGELCEYVAILRSGRMVECNRVDVLKQRAVRQVRLTFHEPMAADIQSPDGFRVQRSSARELSGAWVGPVDRLLEWVARLHPSDVMIAPPSLEDLFLAYYGEHSGDKGESAA